MPELLYRPDASKVNSQEEAINMLGFLDKMMSGCTNLIAMAEQTIAFQKGEIETLTQELNRLLKIIFNMKSSKGIVSLSEYKKLLEEVETIKYEINSVDVILNSAVNELSSALEDLTHYRAQATVIEKLLKDHLGKVYKLSKDRRVAK